MTTTATTDIFDGFDLDTYLADWDRILARDEAELAATFDARDNAWSQTDVDRNADPDPPAEPFTFLLCLACPASLFAHEDRVRGLCPACAGMVAAWGDPATITDAEWHARAASVRAGFDRLIADIQAGQPRGERICTACGGTGRESYLSHDGGQESWPCAEGCNEPISLARTEAYEVYDYSEIPF